MAATALQIVNQVLQLLRDETVTSFTAENAEAVLPIVNQSMRAILDTHDWPFLMRHTGVIDAFGAVEDTQLVTVTNGSTAATINTYPSTGPTNGDYVTRIVVSDATDFPATAVRCANAQRTGGQLVATLADNWPGASIAAASHAHVVFANEFRLPDTVRRVLSVRHQEQPLRLLEVEKNIAFDSIIPRVWETRGDPEVVYIGGTVTTTAATGGTGVSGMGLMVYPVPDAALRLDYSYLYRFADLAATTDTLDGVPLEIVSEIVWHAFGRATASIQGDVERGLLIQRDAQMATIGKRNGNPPDPNRRRQLMSLDHIGRRGAGGDFGRFPRNFGSL